MTIRHPANADVLQQQWRVTSTTTLGTRVVHTQRELRYEATRGQAMGYRIQIGRGLYEGWTDGRPFSLVDAVREINGCGQARIYAPDGRLVFEHAGSVCARSSQIAQRKLARLRRLREVQLDQLRDLADMELMAV